MSALLRCRGLQAGHQGRRVVRDLDVEVASGEIVALLGPNGAGKTTTLSTLAGLLPPLGGTVEIAGRPVTRAGARTRARQGLVLVPDDRSLFTGLTARENLELARRSGGPGLADVLEYVPALEKRLDVSAGLLSGGEQQQLALGRALIQAPRVLLVDELSMGLAPIVVQTLLDVVRRVARDTGAAIVLVEQQARLALEVADRAIVLVHGEVTLAERADSLLADPTALEDAYLGGASSA